MTKNDTRAARGAALFVLGGLAAPAFATTYVWDTLADVSAADGQLSLREVVSAASANASGGLARILCRRCLHTCPPPHAL